ncbi:hypothetical protein ACFY0A_42120, partial [Streptomyces sp. NPDC001698]
MVLEEKWPVLGRHERAAGWLQVWTDLGREPRTIDVYARGLAEYLEMCERENVDPLTANRAHIAVYVRELTSRPSRRGANVVSIDSGSGLANATIQQRLVPVRLFYDFLMEDGQRDSNPVGRGRYTPGRRRGGHERGLVQWVGFLGELAADFAHGVLGLQPAGSCFVDAEEFEQVCLD